MRTKKSFLNLFFNLSGQGINILYGFIVPSLIIRIYGSSVNGLVGSITQLLGYIALFELGIGAVIKSTLYKPLAKKSKKDIRKILKASDKFMRKLSYLLLAYVFILVCFYPMIVEKEFDFIFTVSLILIIATKTFAQYYFGMTYEIFLHASQNGYVNALFHMGTDIINLILIVILCHMHVSIQCLKLVSVLPHVVRPILQRWYVKKKYQIEFTKEDDGYVFKNRYHGIAQHIAYTIHMNTDVLLLTIFKPIKLVSVYDVYAKVVTGIQTFIVAISASFSASFADMVARNEIKNLNEKFGIYETWYNFLCTIIYTCTLTLIIPFIGIYTKGVEDVNYIQELFSIIFICGGMIYALEIPYNSLTNSAGLFKETRLGAILEAVINMGLSILLIHKFDLVGVAIGTLIAMLFRMIDLLIKANKYVLKRNISVSIKKLSVVAINVLIVVFIARYLPLLETGNYLNWFINALMIASVSAIVSFTTNYIADKQNLIGAFVFLKRRKQKL